MVNTSTVFANHFKGRVPQAIARKIRYWRQSNIDSTRYRLGITIGLNFIIRTKLLKLSAVFLGRCLDS